MPDKNASRAHWETVYDAKLPSQASWHQNRPDQSLDLIHRAALPSNSSILDVGGGASTLVDHLLAERRYTLAVLDISQASFAHARKRLGKNAGPVNWIAADIATWTPDISVDFWHDRAVLHFLTERADQEAYFGALKAALNPGGWVMIAGFAPGGPNKCSGLPIVQHDAGSLQNLLGSGFTLIETRNEIHRTPSEVEQAFRYHLFRHSAGASLSAGTVS